jgi:hypothetical protein
MITKTIFFAKTFYTYSMKNLRPKKVFAITRHDENRHTAHKASTAPAATPATGRRRPAAPARHHPGPAPRRETPATRTRAQTPATHPSQRTTATPLIGFLPLTSPPHQGRVRSVDRPHLAQTDANPPPRTPADAPQKARGRRPATGMKPRGSPATSAVLTGRPTWPHGGPRNCHQRMRPKCLTCLGLEQAAARLGIMADTGGRW